KGARGLAGDNARAFVPLIAEAGAGGVDAEVGAGAGAIGQTYRGGSDDDVLVNRQAGAVGNRAAAGAGDHHAVSAGVGRADIGEIKRAGGLTGQGARAFVPLIAEAG